MDPVDECRCLDRRQFLTSTASGIGLAALLTLLREDRVLAAAQGQVPGVPQFAPKAKSCIFFFMEGGPSQFDLFSYKPKLNELDGQKPPASLIEGKRFAFLQKDTAVLLGTPRTFKQYGQSGMWLSNLLPNLARQADKICLLNAVVTNQFNHGPGQLVLQTGNNLRGHPAMGSWLNYGLGTENQNLPGYVVLNSAAFISGGEAVWSSGFLPTSYSGVPFQPVGNPILNLNLPAGVSTAVERRRLDALARLNAIRKEKMMDPMISNRVASYELAFRMQAEAPQLTDLSKESAATLDRYGLTRTDAAFAVASDRRPPGTGYANFAKHCLLARRMVEKGVRFVNVMTGSWDTHSNLNNDIQFFAGMVDQPIAALIQDLSDRGLLDETLVVFAGEFGRTPLGENRPGYATVTGRDHHPDAFSLFMVGGGIKGGLTFGETDDIGWSPVKDGVDISDVHATILRLFGIDHTGLTYKYRGLDQRLTPVTRQAVVLDKLLA
jgi:uncharacterized protein (DUF1501 family)